MFGMFAHRMVLISIPYIEVVYVVAWYDTSYLARP